MQISWRCFSKNSFSWFLEDVSRGKVKDDRFLGYGTAGELVFDIRVKLVGQDILFVCDVSAYREDETELDGHTYDDVGNFKIGKLTPDTTYERLCRDAEEAIRGFIIQEDGDTLLEKAWSPIHISSWI